MRKIVLLVMMMVGIIAATKAQDTILYINNYPGGEYEGVELCLDKYQRALIYAQENCNEFHWNVPSMGTIWNESPLIITHQYDDNVNVTYYGCDFYATVTIMFKQPRVPNSFTHTTWKHNGETSTLEAVGSDSLGYPFNYQFHWSTGETSRTIQVTEPGTYTCEISELCGTATRTFIVKDNVEIDLATCDLSSNLNVVTWSTNPAQAAYISQVIIKRDGIQVGTAPYEDGQFIDNIGSDAASRTYTIIGVMPNGEQCPIESYPKETIHMSYTLGMGNTIEMGWNTPTGYDLMGYNICEWHPNGDLTVIDYVGASVTSYTCNESMFSFGNIVVQGVENGKSESRLLSNRSWETVGVAEIGSETFKVYPNPSNGVLTIKGTGTLRVTNVLGQEIMAREIDGMETFALPKGVYFVRLNGAVRKIVVE